MGAGSFNRSQTAGRSGSNLSQSTYQADNKRLSKMNSAISSGKSVIGASSPKVESKLNNLAMLLGSEDDFKDVFATKHSSVK